MMNLNYRILSKEIFKILNNLNPIFLKNIFHLREIERPVRNKYKLNLEMPKRNQVIYNVYEVCQIHENMVLMKRYLISMFREVFKQHDHEKKDLFSKSQNLLRGMLRVSLA